MQKAAEKNVKNHVFTWNEPFLKHLVGKNSLILESPPSLLKKKCFMDPFLTFLILMENPQLQLIDKAKKILFSNSPLFSQAKNSYFRN